MHSQPTEEPTDVPALNVKKTSSLQVTNELAPARSPEPSRPLYDWETRANRRTVSFKTACQTPEVKFNFENVSTGIPRPVDSSMYQPRFRTVPKVASMDQPPLPAVTSSDTLYSVSSLIREGMCRPNLELIKFDGNPMKYSQFMSTFESTVERIENDNRRRLLYLLQYCKGKAKSLVCF